MIPVWKEEWTTEEQTESGIAFVRFGTDKDGYMLDTPRARLAAAAPDMARLLLRLGDYFGRCIVCTQVGGHDDGCEWLAVMHKAGIRE